MVQMLTPSDSIRPHPTPSDPIWPHLTPSDPIRPHPTPFDPIWPHMTPSDPRLTPIWPPSDPIWPHPSLPWLYVVEEPIEPSRICWEYRACGCCDVPFFCYLFMLFILYLLICAGVAAYMVVTFNVPGRFASWIPQHTLHDQSLCIS